MLNHAQNLAEEEKNKIEELFHVCYPSAVEVEEGEKNRSHPSIMSLICRLKQSDYAKVQLHVMNRFSRTLSKHLNGYSRRGTIVLSSSLSSRRLRDNYRN